MFLNRVSNLNIDKWPNTLGEKSNLGVSRKIVKFAYDLFAIHAFLTNHRQY